MSPPIPRECLFFPPTHPCVNLTQRMEIASLNEQVDAQVSVARL